MPLTDGEQKMMDQISVADMKNRYERRIRAAVRLLAAAACCVFLTFTAYGRETQGENGLEDGRVFLDAVYGYQNMAKSGRFLPIKVSLENREEGSFSGTLCVLTMESDYNLYRYEYPIELAEGEKEERNLSVSLGGQIDQMYLKVLDEEGQEIASKRLKLDVEEGTAQLFIGVLSDSMDRLGYLNNVGISYSTLRTRMIELTPELIPTDGLGLDQLDVLLISNFDTARLSGAQVEAIWDWVGRGGVLLFGTGAYGEKVMNAFGEEILESPLPESEKRDINMGVEFAQESPASATISLTCTDVYLNGAQEILSSDEVTVLSAAQAGSGLVAAAVYDFADIEEFCRENITYVDRMFTELLGESRIQSIVRLSDGTTSEQFWSVQNLINTGDVSRLPDVGLYTIVAAAYVILVGPGLYFFLKHRGLRRYYYSGVLLLALAGTGFMVVMSTSTRFSGPFFTYASVIDAGRDGESEMTFINMRAPSKRPYWVRLNPEYRVYPITQSAYYEQAKPEFNGDEEPSISLRFDQDGTRISIRDTGAFESKYFMMERSGENAGEGFEGDIHFFDGEISGSITSSYPEPLENAALLLYNQMVLIGRIEPGETVDLSGREVIYGAANYGYVMAEQVTGASRYAGSDMEDEDNVRAIQRTNLLAFYMGQSLDSYRQEARIVGFAQSDGRTDFLEEPAGETYGTTLITSPLEVNYTKDSYVYYSALPRDPEVISGEYFASTNTMYSMTPLILEYYLGNDTEVVQVQFRSQSEQILTSLRYNYTVPFTGDVYFYNYNTGNYDRMDSVTGVYSREDLDPYLSPGNTLTVRYLYDQAEDYMGNIILPIVTVIGRSE